MRGRAHDQYVCRDQSTLHNARRSALQLISNLATTSLWPAGPPARVPAGHRGDPRAHAQPAGGRAGARTSTTHRQREGGGRGGRGIATEGGGAGSYDSGCAGLYDGEKHLCL